MISSWTKWISYYLKITNDTNGTNFTNYTCFNWGWQCSDRPMCLSWIAKPCKAHTQVPGRTHRCATTATTQRRKWASFPDEIGHYSCHLLNSCNSCLILSSYLLSWDGLPPGYWSGVGDGSTWLFVLTQDLDYCIIQSWFYLIVSFFYTRLLSCDIKSDQI